MLEVDEQLLRTARSVPVRRGLLLLLLLYLAQCRLPVVSAGWDREGRLANSALDNEIEDHQMALLVRGHLSRLLVGAVSTTGANRSAYPKKRGALPKVLANLTLLPIITPLKSAYADRKSVV